MERSFSVQSSQKSKRNFKSKRKKTLERTRTLYHQDFLEKLLKYYAQTDLHLTMRKLTMITVLCKLKKKSQFYRLLMICAWDINSQRVFSDMLSSFPKGTAAGLSMMYPQHLSNAIRCNAQSSPESQCKNSPA